MQLRPVELGGSIFVEVNKNMWRAVDEFGLERAAYKDANTVMGVWDGAQFVLTVCRLGHLSLCFARTSDLPFGRPVAASIAVGGTKSK